MLQLRQRKADPDADYDCDYDPYYPASMNSSKEIQPMHQSLLRWSNVQDYYHDHGYDFLQQPPRRTFDLQSQSVKHKHRRSVSGLSLSLENLQLCPPSPSPICSPYDDHNYKNTTASISSSFFPPRDSFGQSELHISQQRCRHGEEVAEPTTVERSFPAGEFRRSEKGGMRSTLYGGRKSTSSLLINPRKAPARFSFKDEVRPKLWRQQGISVRRANLPRGKCCSDPQIILRKEIHDIAFELSDINVAQPDPGKNQDSNAINASNKTAKEPKTSSEGFSPSPVQNFHLPVIKRGENLYKKGRAIESSTGLSSTDMNGGVQICDDNVEKRSRSSANIKRSLAFMRSYVERRDEIEAETIDLEGATTARILNWLKRQEEHLIAWERKQKAKADKHMKKIERKIEKKREKEIWKTQKKIALANKQAEKKKAAEMAKIEAENGRRASLGDMIHSVGNLPSNCFFF